MFNVLSHQWLRNRGIQTGVRGAFLLTGLVAASVPVGSLFSHRSEAQTIEVVQVTARRREERSIDVPISMTAMDDEFLRKQNITELNDLGVQVPSLRISNAGTSTNNPIVSIRGQRPSEVTVTVDQAVPIYVNDIVLTPSEGSNLALYDLQSIQVLKGPQGTLYGRNSTGGAILVETKRPGTEFGGYLEFKIGDYDLKSYEGAVDLPVNDVLQFRVSARKMQRDGYQENVAANELQGEEFWDEDSQGARISMNIDLDRLSNLLVLSYDENFMNGRTPVLKGFNRGALVGTIYESLYNQRGQIDAYLAREANRSAFEVESDVIPRDEVKVWFASNKTEYELTDAVTIKSILGYRKTEYGSSVNSDGTALPIQGALTSLTDDVTFDSPLPTTKAEQFSWELQFVGDALDGKLEWLGGLYGFKMRGNVGGDELIQVGGGIPNHTRRQAWGDIIDFAIGDFGAGAYPTANLDLPWDTSSGNSVHPLDRIQAMYDYNLWPAFFAGTYTPPPLAQYTAGLTPADLQLVSDNAFFAKWIPFGDDWAPYGFLQSQDSDVQNTAIGIFAEGTYSFNELWSLTLGLRYSKDKREFWQTTFSGLGQSAIDRAQTGPVGVSGSRPFSCNLKDENGNWLPNNDCQRYDKTEFEAVTGRFSLNYTPVDGILAYGSVSSGYRTGGLNVRGTDNASMQPFEDENVMTYELGYKADWSIVNDWPFLTNFAVYYQDYQDIQKTNQTYSQEAGFGTQVVNAAGAYIEGAEFDVTWVATDNLTFTLAYSYTDAGYKDWQAPVVATDPVSTGGRGLLGPQTVLIDAKGADFTYIPRNTATFSFTYNLPIAPEWGDLSLFASVYWQDEMVTHPYKSYADEIAALNKVPNWGPAETQIFKDNATADAYEIYNVRLDWRSVMDSSFDLAFYVNNATDEEYIVGGLNVIDVLGIHAATYGAPRTMGAALRYNF